jgi:hypothetical protein
VIYADIQRLEFMVRQWKYQMSNGGCASRGHILGAGLVSQAHNEWLYPSFGIWILTFDILCYPCGDNN